VGHHAGAKGDIREGGTERMTMTVTVHPSMIRSQPPVDSFKKFFQLGFVQKLPPMAGSE